MSNWKLSRSRWLNRLVVLSALVMTLGLATPAAAEECGEAYADCLWDAFAWGIILPGVRDLKEKECLADYTACVLEMFMA